MTVLSDTQFADAISTALHEEASHVLEDVSIGITGTRQHPADSQSHTLTVLLSAIYRTAPRIKGMHHGCATGIDEYSHGIALSIPGTDIYGHPGYGAGKRQPYLMPIKPEQFTILYPAKPYRERNLNIVTYSGLLIGCPLYPEQDARSARSGTWQTIRFARRAQKPILLVIPNGRIIRDNNRHAER